MADSFERPRGVHPQPVTPVVDNVEVTEDTPLPVAGSVGPDAVQKAIDIQVRDLLTEILMELKSINRHLAEGSDQVFNLEEL